MHLGDCLVPNILICSTEAAEESLIYSYGRSFHGFAAKLSDEEVARFSGETVIMQLYKRLIHHTYIMHECFPMLICMN
jgi:hypothetical protein